MINEFDKNLPDSQEMKYRPIACFTKINLFVFLLKISKERTN